MNQHSEFWKVQTMEVLYPLIKKVVINNIMFIKYSTYIYNITQHKTALFYYNSQSSRRLRSPDHSTLVICKAVYMPPCLLPFLLLPARFHTDHSVFCLSTGDLNMSWELPLCPTFHSMRIQTYPSNIDILQLLTDLCCRIF